MRVNDELTELVDTITQIWGLYKKQSQEMANEKTTILQKYCLFFFGMSASSAAQFINRLT